MGLRQRHIMARDAAGARGRVQLILWDAAFEPMLRDDPMRLFRAESYRRHVHRVEPWRSNLIVKNAPGGFGNGHNLVRDFLAGTNPPFPTHIAWGTNGTAPTLADVALYTEQVRTEIIARVPDDGMLTIGGFMGSVTGNGQTFREAALMTGPANTAARIYARIAYNDVTKSVSLLISLSWQLTFS